MFVILVGSFEEHNLIVLHNVIKELPLLILKQVFAFMLQAS